MQRSSADTLLDRASTLLGKLPPGSDDVIDAINYGRYSSIKGKPSAYWIHYDAGARCVQETGLTFKEARSALAEALAERSREEAASG